MPLATQRGHLRASMFQHVCSLSVQMPRGVWSGHAAHVPRGSPGAKFTDQPTEPGLDTVQPAAFVLSAHISLGPRTLAREPQHQGSHLLGTGPDLRVSIWELCPAVSTILQLRDFRGRVVFKFQASEFSKSWSKCQVLTPAESVAHGVGVQEFASLTDIGK